MGAHAVGADTDLADIEYGLSLEAMVMPCMVIPSYLKVFLFSNL